jgi:hypothetical protein
MLAMETQGRFDLRFEQPPGGDSVTLWLAAHHVVVGPAVFRGADFTDIAATIEDAGRLVSPDVRYDGSGRGELVIVTEQLEPGRFRVSALVLGTACPPAELDADQMEDLVRVLEDAIRLVGSNAHR